MFLYYIWSYMRSCTQDDAGIVLNQNMHDLSSSLGEVTHNRQCPQCLSKASRGPMMTYQFSSPTSPCQQRRYTWSAARCSWQLQLAGWGSSRQEPGTDRPRPCIGWSIPPPMRPLPPALGDSDARTTQFWGGVRSYPGCCSRVSVLLQK